MKMAECFGSEMDHRGRLRDINSDSYGSVSCVLLPKLNGCVGV